MPDWVRLAYYPFLPEVREAVREAGAGLEDVLRSTLHERARRRATERVRGALADGFAPATVLGERDAIDELLSVGVARMLVVALADRTLATRYARAEADHAQRALERDPDPTALDAAVAATGLVVTPDGEGARMHVADYLVAAPIHEAEWKLIRRPLDRGQVRLARADLVRLVRERLAARGEQELVAELARPMPAPLKELLEPLVTPLKPALEEARENWSSGDFGPAQPGLFPPCMKELFAAMARGENVPHHGRFAFATFMGTIGLSANEILDYLATTPNFDREKSRYQIEHVTGERGVDKYTPPGCATMQTNGVCPLDKRDGLCFKIKHPLSYYRAKLRFQKNDEAKANPPGRPMAASGATA